jgi:hypothetical protein
MNPLPPDRQPQLGIHMPSAPQFNPNQLPQLPQLGDVVHPNDIPGTERAQADLAPPALAGAEQDMQVQSLEHHLSQKGFRLGGYFRMVLGRRDS